MYFDSLNFRKNQYWIYPSGQTGVGTGVGRKSGHAAQFISVLEKRVHEPFLHKANEGNEEICPPMWEP
jgi:hypothetical protein